MGVQIHEIPMMDSIKSQLNHKLILIGKKILMTFMPYVRSVDKGAFLLVRAGVNSPMRANYIVKFHS